MDDFVSVAFSCLIGAGLWAISPEAREPIPETQPATVVEVVAEDSPGDEVSVVRPVEAAEPR